MTSTVLQFVKTDKETGHTVYRNTVTGEFIIVV